MIVLILFIFHLFFILYIFFVNLILIYQLSISIVLFHDSDNMLLHNEHILIYDNLNIYDLGC